jgi:hypothetical protein
VQIPATAKIRKANLAVYAKFDLGFNGDPAAQVRLNGTLLSAAPEADRNGRLPSGVDGRRPSELLGLRLALPHPTISTLVRISGSPAPPSSTLVRICRTARVSAIGAALADQMPLVLDAAIAVLESILPVFDAAHPAHYQIGHRSDPAAWLRSMVVATRTVG